MGQEVMARAYAYVRPTDGLAGAMAKRARKKANDAPAYQVKISDAACKDMLRDYFLGMPIRYAAEKHGVREGYLYSIVNGGNRQRLLIQVKKELERK